MATHLNQTDARTVTVLAVFLPVVSMLVFLAISLLLLLEPLVRMHRTRGAPPAAAAAHELPASGSEP